MAHVGDITKLNGAELPPVELVCGGSPCQDLSVAGARAGLSGERSGLFMEQIRIVKEMRNADELRGRAALDIRPRFMVWENVPGAFSSGTPKGEDFRIVLEEIVRIKKRYRFSPSTWLRALESAGESYWELICSPGVESHRHSILARHPAKTASYLPCRRFCRTIRPSNTI